MDVNLEAFAKYCKDQDICFAQLHNNMWQPLFRYTEEKWENIVKRVTDTCKEFPGFYHVTVKKRENQGAEYERKMFLDARTAEQIREPNSSAIIHVRDNAPAPQVAPQDSAQVIESRLRREFEQREEMNELKRLHKETLEKLESAQSVSGQITQQVMALIKGMAGPKMTQPIMQGAPAQYNPEMTRNRPQTPREQRKAQRMEENAARGGKIPGTDIPETPRQRRIRERQEKQQGHEPVQAEAVPGVDRPLTPREERIKKRTGSLPSRQPLAEDVESESVHSPANTDANEAAMVEAFEIMQDLGYDETQAVQIFYTGQCL